MRVCPVADEVAALATRSVQGAAPRRRAAAAALMSKLSCREVLSRGGSEQLVEVDPVVLGLAAQVQHAEVGSNEGED